MRSILGEHEMGVFEDPGCELERNTVLGLVVTSLLLVPLELHYTNVDPGS